MVFEANGQVSKLASIARESLSTRPYASLPDAPGAVWLRSRVFPGQPDPEQLIRASARRLRIGFDRAFFPRRSICARFAKEPVFAVRPPS